MPDLAEQVERCLPSFGALRPYQSRAIDCARGRFSAGVRRLLLVAPTGSGKTVIARAIIEAAVARGTRVVFVAPRKELIEQTSKHLDGAGIDHGILQGAHWRHRPWLPVQVATTPTLMRRDLAEPPGLMFLDEAHVFHRAALSLRERFPDAALIGMTATPIRLDGRGLGEIFEEFVTVAEMRELIDAGHLTGFRILAPPWGVVIGAVRTTAGDYNRADLSRAVDRPKLTGDVVDTWVRRADRRPTITFAVDVAHSKHLVEEYRARGVRAVHVDADSAPAERVEATRGLSDGRIDVVCNVELFTYGVDVPRVSCVSIARPTQSLALHLQMLGRGLRPSPGKDDLLVLDHAGNTYLHGFPDEIRNWSLDGTKKAKGARPPSLRRCLQCFGLSRAGAEACELCGAAFPVSQGREIRHVDGELQEAGGFAAYARKATEEHRIRSLAKWIKQAQEREYSRGWAFVKFEKVFGRKVDPRVIDRAHDLLQAPPPAGAA